MKKALLLFGLFAFSCFSALGQLRKYKETIQEEGDATYIVRTSLAEIYIQNNKNVWLKDSTNWLNNSTFFQNNPTIYRTDFSAESTIEMDSLIHIVFQDNKKRLKELQKTEQPLIFHLLVDKKEGRVHEVLFDMAVSSKLRYADLYRFEEVLKKMIKFHSFIFEDGERGAAAAFIIITEYAAFKDVLSIDPDSL